MPKKIIIIGAGIGGLSAGCYAQMNGYQAHIFEMHSAPGGQCTSWTRQGFTFDGCIHNLAGTTPSSPFARMWAELGVTARMHAFKEMVAIEAPDGGRPLLVCTNLDQLQKELKSQFPTDSLEIDRLIEAARKMAKVDLLGLALGSPPERLRAVIRLGPLAPIGCLTLEQYARRFRDPVLRKAFPRIIYDWPQQSMFMALYFLAGLDKGDLGWPIGGSGAFARSIEERFKTLGGRITYQAVVSSIVVENDRAVGVRLADGAEHRADIVISNAYGPTTVFGMLGGRYAPDAMRRRYAAGEDDIEMGVHVSLGVGRNLTDEPHAIVLPLKAPVEIDGKIRDRLFIQTFGYDPSMAPTGKGVIKVLLPTSWTRWEELAHSPRRYRDEQDTIAKTVLDALEQRFPGLSSQVEAVDVATPITTKRFTGVGRGFGFAVGDLVAATLLGQNAGRALPGLKNFYMVGQWAGPPGVPMVAAMGRELVREICKRDRRRFVTTTPAQAPEPETTAWRGAA
jgi:phytoene dehydrogenase-like protein